jgi:hypothetical protein
MPAGGIEDGQLGHESLFEQRLDSMWQDPRNLNHRLPEWVPRPAGSSCDEAKKSA